MRKYRCVHCVHMDGGSTLSEDVDADGFRKYVKIPKIIQPGEVIELTDELAAELLPNGAVRILTAQEMALDNMARGFEFRDAAPLPNDFYGS